MRVALNELYHKIERMEGERLIASSIHLKEEEVYDIFRNIFHNEEDALAATIQLFRAIQFLGIRPMINMNTNKPNIQFSLIVISGPDN